MQKSPKQLFSPLNSKKIFPIVIAKSGSAGIFDRLNYKHTIPFRTAENFRSPLPRP